MVKTLKFLAVAGLALFALTAARPTLAWDGGLFGYYGYDYGWSMPYFYNPLFASSIWPTYTFWNPKPAPLSLPSGNAPAQMNYWTPPAVNFNIPSGTAPSQQTYWTPQPASFNLPAGNTPGQYSDYNPQPTPLTLPAGNTSAVSNYWMPQPMTLNTPLGY